MLGHVEGFEYQIVLLANKTYDLTLLSTGPTLQCRNIYVLPGVPKFFEDKVSSLASYLSTSIERSATYKVVLSVDETSIVEALNGVVKRHPYVSIGSYPFFEHPDFKTVVTLEGREGPSLFPGETRITIRKRSESLLRQISEQNATTLDGVDGASPMSSNALGLFTKEEMDLHVKMALADLVSVLPEGSVLRVDNNDDLS